MLYSPFLITISDEQNDAHNYKTVSATGKMNEMNESAMISSAFENRLRAGLV